MIKLFKPFISQEAIQYAVDVMNTDNIAEGETVRKFEQYFESKTGLTNCVALNSGTSALELAYELAGIEEGDEVITPVLTCTATNIPLIHRKAKIVFADIDYDLNINIEDVKKKITNKTKAIVFVHFGGNNRGLRELEQLSRKYNIKLIEDAAQAIGSDYWGVGDFTCVSLQAIKTITTGDGGILSSKRKEDYEKAKKLKWFGYDREAKQRGEDVDLELAGYKYHMNNISAAIGLGNIQHLDALMSHIMRLKEIYSEYGITGHLWLAGGLIDDYESLKAEYLRAGIEIGQHHYRNDKYSLFKEYKNDCPVMDEIEGKYFFVPFHYAVTESDARQIGIIYGKIKKNTLQ